MFESFISLLESSAIIVSFFYVFIFAKATLSIIVDYVSDWIAIILGVSFWTFSLASGWFILVTFILN